MKVSSTAELTGDGRNPRKISGDAQQALGNSLERFGDLSGIVFNVRTGELVTGHRRIDQIRANWGDFDIKVLDAEHELGAIEVDAEHYFPVRVVDWTAAKQRAANVTANNFKLQGRFTGDLANYLLEVESELSEELPGVLDDLLLTELLASGLDTSDATENDSTDSEVEEAEVKETYQVVVECQDEADQQAVYTQVTDMGYKCRVLTV